MFQKWSGRAEGSVKCFKTVNDVANTKGNIGTTNSGHDNRTACESIDDLKHRLLPTLTGAPEQNGRVVVWRMPIEISQSRLAGRYRPSNACTIIVVKLAEYIYREGITLRPSRNPNKNNSNASRCRPKKWPPKIFADIEAVEKVGCDLQCSAQLLNAFVNAIIEGNAIHEKQMAQRCPLYYDRHAETFTIPQALEGCGNVFYEIEYVTVRGRIIDNLKAFLVTPIESNFLKDHLQIYMILIVFERSVLLVYERECNSIFLIDTHTHLETKNLKSGGLVAMCSLDNLDYLIKWMCKNVFPETKSKLDCDQSFEVSVISFNGQLCTEDHPQFVPQIVEKHRVFPKRRINQLPRAVALRLIKRNRTKSFL